MGDPRGQQGSYRRINVAASGMHFTQCAQEFLAHGALQNVSPRPHLQRTKDFLLARMGGEHQDVGLGKLLPDGRSGLGAALLGKTHIHNDQAGMMLAAGGQRGFAIGGFGHHLHVGLNVEGRRQAHADHEVVIHDQNAYGF